MEKNISYVSERDKYLDMAGATIDGLPARIAGRLRRFATISGIGDKWHTQAEYSWETVKRIMDSDKKFYTH